MDWTSTYAIEYRLFRVDPDTWDDEERIAGLVSATVNTDGTDDVPLLETVTIEMDRDIGSSLEEGYYRLSCVTSQDGYEAFDIATFLLMPTGGTYDYGYLSQSISGYSVLKPADERKLQFGTYAPAGVNGADYCVDMLEEVLDAPVDAEGSFTLSTNIVFDQGTSYLSAVWSVLDSAGWILHIHPDGSVTVMPKPTEPSIVLDKSTMSLVGTSFAEKLDISEVPNAYTAVLGDEAQTAVNDDEDSPTSIPSRGRRIDEVDTSPTLVDGETLYQYAERMLEEKSTVTRQWQYVREYVPDAKPFDQVFADLSDKDFIGTAGILSQTINCTAEGIKVSETAGEAIKYYDD